MTHRESPQHGLFLRGVLAAGLLSLLAGCGGPAGPPRYELSGKVTYGGQPVPAGSIMFAPDKSQGNDGPGASVEIKDGVYRTRPGEGTIGGPHAVTINGFDGKAFQPAGIPEINPMGQPLFVNFQTKVDLPKQSSTRDFAIPAQTK